MAEKQFFDGDVVTGADLNRFQQKVPLGVQAVYTATNSLNPPGFPAIVWTALPTSAVKTEITLDAPCYCWVQLSTWLVTTGTAPASLRVTSGLSGATVRVPGATGGGDLLEGTFFGWHDVIVAVDHNSGEFYSTVHPYKFNTGRTVAEVFAYRSSNATTANLSYTSLRIIPFRWA
jgi:hypothetical protein